MLSFKSIKISKILMNNNFSGVSGVRDGKDLVIAEEPASPTHKHDKDDLQPKSRPRSKSDKFTRPTKKQVVDVYKQVGAFFTLTKKRKVYKIRNLNTYCMYCITYQKSQ